MATYSTQLLCLVALLCVLALSWAAPATAEQDYCPFGALRPEPWVANLVAHLKSIGMVEDRVAYLKVAVNNDTRSFSGKQVLSILSTIPLEEYTLEAMAFLQPFVTGLTKDEFISVLLAFGMEEARLKVLPAIKETLFNGSTADKVEIVNRCFGMSANRQQAMAILASVQSRDCIFGTMQEDYISIVVDTSSLTRRKFFYNNKPYTQLSFVVEHLKKSLQTLKPTQVFYILSYNSAPYALFPNPVFATAANIQSALSILDRWGPDMSTVRDCYGGLYAGFTYNPKATGIYFVSAGVPNQGTGSEQLIYASIPQWNSRRQPQYQARIYATALLAGNTDPADKQATTTFVSAVAGAGKGVFRAIDTQ